MDMIAEPTASAGAGLGSVRPHLLLCDVPLPSEGGGGACGARQQQPVCAALVVAVHIAPHHDRAHQQAQHTYRAKHDGSDYNTVVLPRGDHLYRQRMNTLSQEPGNEHTSFRTYGEANWC